jgi:hypothetical protein
LKKLFETFIVVVSLIVFVLFLFVFVLDWSGGCGEVYEYANGTLHQGECVGRDILNSFIKEVFK